MSEIRRSAAARALAGAVARAAVPMLLISWSAWVVIGGTAWADDRDPGWRSPLPGRPEVLRGYDPPRLPWGPGHRGVDLAAPVGSPVLAAGAGAVTFAGPVAGRGVVVVSHDGGLRTTYEPVHAEVRVGEQVDPGGRLGQVTSGGHCGRPSCLHWGLRRADAYLDPLALLGARPGPLVLLPYLAPERAERPSADEVAPAPVATPRPVAARGTEGGGTASTAIASMVVAAGSAATAGALAARRYDSRFSQLLRQASARR